MAGLFELAACTSGEGEGGRYIGRAVFVSPTEVCVGPSSSSPDVTCGAVPPGITRLPHLDQCVGLFPRTLHAGAVVAWSAESLRLRHAARDCATRAEPSAPRPEVVARAEIVDVPTARAVWRVACGRDKGTRFVAAVASSSFEVESKPADPAAGHVDEVSLSDWATFYAAKDEWIVTVNGLEATSVRSYAAPNDHDPCA